MQDLTLYFQEIAIPFVFVKGGDFEMGGESFSQSSLPAHPVTLSDFWVGKYLVTQELWEAVMLKNPSFFKNSPQNPVEQVTWQETAFFIAKITEALHTQLVEKVGQEIWIDLPTEAQWEYSAKGGKDFVSAPLRYAGSQDADEVAWYEANSAKQSKPIGLKKPNQLGIYDMTGNVWEWCKDWYDKDYYKKCVAQNIVQNPYNFTPSPHHTMRGGSWNNSAGYLNIQNSTGHLSDEGADNIGFRLALY